MCEIIALEGTASLVEIRTYMVLEDIARKREQCRIQDFSQGWVHSDGLVLEYY